MSYDFDEETTPFMNDGRTSERFSTMSSMCANYDQKLNNITTELSQLSKKVANKLK